MPPLFHLFLACRLPGRADQSPGFTTNRSLMWLGKEDKTGCCWTNFSIHATSALNSTAFPGMPSLTSSSSESKAKASSLVTWGHPPFIITFKFPRWGWLTTMLPLSREILQSNFCDSIPMGMRLDSCWRWDHRTSRGHLQPHRSSISQWYVDHRVQLNVFAFKTRTNLGESPLNRWGPHRFPHSTFSSWTSSSISAAAEDAPRHLSLLLWGWTWCRWGLTWRTRQGLQHPVGLLKQVFHHISLTRLTRHIWFSRQNFHLSPPPRPWQPLALSDWTQMKVQGIWSTKVTSAQCCHRCSSSDVRPSDHGWTCIPCLSCIQILSRKTDTSVSAFHPHLFSLSASASPCPPPLTWS